jgi:hypothetical protein
LTTRSFFCSQLFLLAILFYTLGSAAHALTVRVTDEDPPGRPMRRMKALIDDDQGPTGTDFGDPSPPDDSQKGLVQIYTTGGEVLVWRDSGTETAWNKLLRGARPEHQTMVIYHHDGQTQFDPIEAGEDPWDPTVEIVPEWGNKPRLFAGVMTPTLGKYARWPEDHWNRRTFAFEKIGNRWVMAEESMFGPIPQKTTWIGHNYGHDFVRDEDGKLFMFYERVSEERGGAPWKTEIFARSALGPEKLGKVEYPILRFNHHPWPATNRRAGGYLVEGPRVFKINLGYLLAFSSGDYQSDTYGMNLLWSAKLLGPYLPYLNQSGDLRNFGSELEASAHYPLTWGAARPAFFEHDGQWWVIFHGVRQELAPPREDAHRTLFIAPVEISERPTGPPEIRIHAN